MNKVIRIILSIVGALVMFLAGWLAHAWKNRDKIAKEVRQAILDLNKEHKKAIKALHKGYEEKLRKKDEIIASLKKIIDRLINELDSLRDSNIGAVNKLKKNLSANRTKLDNM